MKSMSQVIILFLESHLSFFSIKRKPSQVSFAQMLQHSVSVLKAISYQLSQLSGASIGIKPHAQDFN